MQIKMVLKPQAWQMALVSPNGVNLTSHVLQITLL